MHLICVKCFEFLQRAQKIGCELNTTVFNDIIVWSIMDTIHFPFNGFDLLLFDEKHFSVNRESDVKNLNYI